MISRTVRFLDERAGAVPFLRKALRYVFPDHWSFLLGEVALYSFVILVGTGIYLTLFFKPSLAPVVYHGDYLPLRGRELSEAYQSTVDISLRIKAGLLIRQTHHWAADVFVAAIVLHLLRIFFTGAFRKPRDLTYYIGLLMLILALLEGYLGYSLVDDLLSGMGLAIGYSVAMSVPFIGANIAQLLWDGPFPGSDSFMSRMYVAHVLVLPVLIGTLIVLHVTLVAARHHTQFISRRATEKKVVGMPTFPAYAPRSLGLAFAVAAVLFLMGGLIQINPIWQWGPYHVSQATNGAQPDWYLGWLIGALRLVPSFDVTVDLHRLPRRRRGSHVRAVRALVPGSGLGVPRARLGASRGGALRHEADLRGATARRGRRGTPEAGGGGARRLDGQLGRDPLGERLRDAAPDLGRLLEQRVELALRDHEDVHVGGRGHRGRPRHLRHECDLAEEVRSPSLSPPADRARPRCARHPAAPAC